VIVREATLYDLPDLTFLWGGWAQEKGHQMVDLGGWFDQQYAGMAAGSILCVVAVAGGSCVGFADASLGYEPATREHFASGRHLFVSKQFRWDGLGDRIMLRLLALSRQSGVSYYLTHGTPSAAAFAKYLGKDMEDYAVLKRIRL